MSAIKAEFQENAQAKAYPSLRPGPGNALILLRNMIPLSASDHHRPSASNQSFRL